MATEAKKRANRANAARSTGPRTTEGRRRSSANATGHGLTTPLPGARVLTWYRCILGEAGADVGTMTMDLLREAAMALAEAEAHLERARKAEEDFLWDLAENRNLPVHLRETIERVEHISRHIPGVSPEVEKLIFEATGLVPSETKYKTRTFWTAPHVHHERLARHRRAAEVRRRKALQAWIETLEDRFSKRSQTQPRGD